MAARHGRVRAEARAEPGDARRGGREPRLHRGRGGEARVLHDGARRAPRVSGLGDRSGEPAAVPEHFCRCSLPMSGRNIHLLLCILPVFHCETRTQQIQGTLSDYEKSGYQIQSLHPSIYFSTSFRGCVFATPDEVRFRVRYFPCILLHFHRHLAFLPQCYDCF